jgi:hypothetical protein
MVAAGHDEDEDKARKGDPLARVLGFARGMLHVVRNFTAPNGERLRIRIVSHRPSFGGFGHVRSLVFGVVAEHLGGALLASAPSTHAWQRASLLLSFFLLRGAQESRQGSHSGAQPRPLLDWSERHAPLPTPPTPCPIASAGRALRPGLCGRDRHEVPALLLPRRHGEGAWACKPCGPCSGHRASLTMQTVPQQAAWRAPAARSSLLTQCLPRARVLSNPPTQVNVSSRMVSPHVEQPLGPWLPLTTSHACLPLRPYPVPSCPAHGFVLACVRTLSIALPRDRLWLGLCVSLTR